MSESGTNFDAEAKSSAKSSQENDLTALGYEQARDQLVAVVRELETGGLSLEESLTLWEKGESLAKICEKHLEGARERIEAALASVENENE
jgi:exodeoxyribonuclease VII small subunit